MIKKLTDFLYDITVGLAHDYQAKAVDLAKIQAATLYVKTVKKVRDHFVVALTLIFLAVLSAVGLVLLSVAAVILMPGSHKIKLVIIGILAVLFVLIPLWVINRYVSEKNWMRLTKTDEILEDVISN